MNSTTSEEEPIENAQAPEAETGSAAEKTEAPSDPVSALQQEVARWKDVALRGQAELENFRKRMTREKADAIKFGNTALLEDLFPIIDNFRFGLDAARQESENSVVFQGMSMVMKQLSDFLVNQGVTEFGEPGEVFDPNLHEAVQLEFSNTRADGQILTTLRRGYRLQDRVLRAANVVVSKGPAPASQTSDEATAQG
jgi:molecular chaperone GrpE